MTTRALALFALYACSGCGMEVAPDDSGRDAARSDAAAATDAGASDVGQRDAGVSADSAAPSDSARVDAVSFDARPSCGAASDAAGTDAFVVPDASDAGTEDAADGGASGRIVVSIVERAVRRPLADVHVRAVDVHGAAIELVTDASGLVTLDPSGAPWSVTAAKAGYSALSLLSVRSSPSVPLRLDPLAGLFTDYPAHPISGTIAGMAVGSDQVQIDCTDADTVRLDLLVDPPQTTWSAHYYVSPDTATTPIHCVALEIGPAPEHALRSFVELDLPRTGAPVTGVDIVFPCTPPTPQTTTYHIAFSEQDYAVFGSCGDARVTVVQQLGGPDEQQFILVGSGVATFVPEPPPSRSYRVDYTMSHFGGTAMPNFAWLTLGCSLSASAMGPLVNLGLRPLGGDHSLTVQPFTSVHTTGTSVSDAHVVAVDARGYDYLSVDIGESDTQIPRWRVIAPIETGLLDVAIPQLPSAVTTSDIGLSGPTTTINAILVEQGDYPIYGAAPSNSPSIHSLVGVGFAYDTVALP